MCIKKYLENLYKLMISDITFLAFEFFYSIINEIDI